MQTVTQGWEDTNRSLFTREAKVTLSIERADGKSPMISDDDIISFSHIKSGDILSGSLPQDKIVFTVRNRNNRLDYDAENDNDVYENARVNVTEAFMNAEYSGYDGISGGIYYVSDVKRDARNDRYQFTAQTILAFMTEKCVGTVIYQSISAYALAQAVIAQAERSTGVPQSNIDLICDDAYLQTIPIEMIEGTDNYSLAATLQLVAAASGCLLYVDRQSNIHIEKRGSVTEHYVMASKFLYSPLSIEFGEKIGNVTIQSNHGQSIGGTDYEGDKIGGTKTANIPILNDPTSTAVIALSFFMYNELTKGRRRFKAKCRFDPALDLFDIIVVPNGKDVSAAIITSINATYSGAWKADIQASVIPDATLDLRIKDIELLTIEQFESLEIEQLVPDSNNVTLVQTETEQEV